MLKKQKKPHKRVADALLADDFVSSDERSPIPTRKSVTLTKRVRKAMAASVARQSLAAPGGIDSQKKRARISVGDWPDRQVASVTIPALPSSTNGSAPRHNRQDVIVALPRRAQRRPGAPGLEAQDKFKPVSARLKVNSIPSVSRIMLLRRLWVWAGLILYFVGQVVSDILSGRDTEHRRAVHLRQTVERTGGTLVKIGQQMSMRLDILPVSYCEQLAVMRDKMPPFPTAAAVAVIERSTGKRINEIFTTFDPVAVDSSSVWCVYQAVLRENGEKVAVKVRRPGINVLFEADIRILSSLTRWAEALTLIAPGFAADFYREVRKTLTDELDFKRGARYEELFARHARQAKKRFFTTRRIYYDYLSDEVMIREFASGMWLWEILASLENGDEGGMAYMQTLNLDPKKLAKRLLFIHHWSLFEHLTFHAAPSPSNIIIGTNNHLIFVDFGVNGFLRAARRSLFRRFYVCMAREDVWGMAQATVALLEPLPARDINMLAKEIELTYYEQLLAMTNKSGHWYERTSAAMWLAAFKVIKRYKIPAPLDVLMVVRAVLLYDTLAARLWPQVDYQQAMSAYTRDAEKRRRKKGMRDWRQRQRTGILGKSGIGSLETIASAGEDLLFRMERLLNIPYDFAVISLTIEKWVFTLMTAIHFVIRAAIFSAVIVALLVVAQLIDGKPADVQIALQQLTASVPYWLVIGVVALLHLRIILFRLGDKTRKEI